MATSRPVADADAIFDPASCDRYAKPQAVSTCKASGSIGTVAHRNNTASSASWRRQAAICSTLAVG